MTNFLYDDMDTIMRGVMGGGADGSRKSALDKIIERNRALQPVDTTVLNALSAQNRADPRSVAGSINDLAQPLLKRLARLAEAFHGAWTLLSRSETLCEAQQRGVY